MLFDYLGGASSVLKHSGYHLKNVFKQGICGDEFFQNQQLHPLFSLILFALFFIVDFEMTNDCSKHALFVI